jgi:hypothetical protein
MRFRTKFAWPMFAASFLWTGLSLAWVHKPMAALGLRSAYLILGIVQMCTVIFMIAHYIFTWWAVEDAGLVQHRLWSTRITPWSEIIRVGPWVPNKKPINNWLAVDYMRAAPISDRGELLFQPADRDALVRALRTHVPQADFEFIPIEI